jgi:hypothetical protein
LKIKGIIEMRVRLYEVGDRCSGNILRIDEFPASLSFDASGQIMTRNLGRLPPVCQLEDIGGQILVKVGNDDLEVGINDAEIEYGPLMPGDHLHLGDRRYVVSYERTATVHPPSMRVKVTT